MGLNLEGPTGKVIPDAQRLIELRRILGVSQRDLAKEFNVSHGTISMWETGTREIPGIALRLIELYESNLGLTPAKNHLKSLRLSWIDRTVKPAQASWALARQLSLNSTRSLIQAHETSEQLNMASDCAIVLQLVEILKELKGLPMKLGQLLSFIDVGMSEPAKLILAELTRTSPGLEPSKVKQIVESELKGPLQLRFSEFDLEARCSASLGQVHFARLLNGQAVAVKVQYPGIRETLELDLRNLKLLNFLSSVFLDRLSLDELLSDLRNGLLLECDYLREARLQEEFRRHLDPKLRIRIPKAYPDLSTPRMLVQDWVEGVSLESFCKSAPENLRAQTAEDWFRFSIRMAFQNHLMNCDPNPGNFIANDSGLWMIDFGCVNRFEPKFIDQWRLCMDLTLEDRKMEVMQKVEEIGFYSKKNPYSQDEQYLLLRGLVDPLLQSEPYQISPDYIPRLWRSQFVNNPHKFKTRFPQGWVWTFRFPYGIYSILEKFKVPLHYRTLFYRESRSRLC